MTTCCGAIILAAGQSRRMGSNKLLAEFRGKPLVAHVADAIRAAGLPMIVVLGHAAADVRNALAGYQADFVTATDHAAGMGHSLAAGIAAVPPEWQAAIICLGDMPLISPNLLRRMAQGASRSAILTPTFVGQRGNPLLWGRDHFPELALLRGDVGARALLSRLSPHIAEIPWADDSILRDVDTPSSLSQIKHIIHD